MRMKTLLLAPAAAVAALALAAGPASAGEVNGNGAPTPPGTFGHAQSICSFSGLEDGSEGGPAGPGVTQNWGSIPKPIRDILAAEGEHPGDACNGHTGFVAMATGE